MGAVDMPRLGNLAAGATPVDIAFAARTDRIASKLDLLGFSRHLEHWAAESSERPVVLATFQTADRFPPATRSWYADLATTCSFVGAMGRGMAASPAPGVRGWSLSDNEALVGQWNVLVVGRHIAGALIALDLNDPDGTPDAERRFRFVITYDRALVVEAARALMARVVAVPLES
jgi:DICT domain-containing protein